MFVCCYNEKMTALRELQFNRFLDVETVEKSEVIVHQVVNFYLVLKANCEIITCGMKTSTSEFILLRVKRLTKHLLMVYVVPDADSLVLNAASKQYRALQTSLQH